jgi:hypothetical protein
MTTGAAKCTCAGTAGARAGEELLERVPSTSDGGVVGVRGEDVAGEGVDEEEGADPFAFKLVFLAKKSENFCHFFFLPSFSPSSGAGTGTGTTSHLLASANRLSFSLSIPRSSLLHPIKTGASTNGPENTLLSSSAFIGTGNFVPSPALRRIASSVVPLLQGDMFSPESKAAPLDLGISRVGARSKCACMSMYVRQWLFSGA